MPWDASHTSDVAWSGNSEVSELTYVTFPVFVETVQRSLSYVDVFDSG
jgi:hypothetical protein